MVKNINDALVPVTKELSSLNCLHIDIIPENSLFDISAEKKEVYRKISNISTSKSPGSDGIPNWVLKCYAHVLASPVASIFNASIQQASVTTMWKKASSKIPKLSSPEDTTNDLCLISLTSTLAKTCERFVTHWHLSI